MKKLISRQFVGLFALLCSSAGLAATVNVTPSTANPIAAGSTFNLVISSPDMPLTTGFTLGLHYDPSAVTVNSVAFIAPFTFAVWTVGGTPGTTDLISLLNTNAVLSTGPFEALQINLTAASNLAVDTAANIALIDDGLDLIWTDPDGLAIPATYNQANLIIAALGGPIIVVTDSVTPTDDHSVLFGNVALSVDATQTVTVTNTGNAVLNVGPVTSPTGDFTLSDDTCSSQAIAASGGTCTITVHFIPTANGSASSSFDIPSNAQTVTVNVSGVGGLPHIAVTDNDAVGPGDPVQFGDVQTNGPPSDLTVTITNTGPGGVLNLGTLTSPADTHFTLQDNPCDGVALTPAAQCMVTVRFTPTVAGVLNSSFTIPSDDAGTPTVVNLNGNGVAPPTADIAVSENSPIPFGDVEVGQTSSPAVTVTVTNNGGLALVVGQVTVTAQFAITNDICSNQSIPAAGTCTFDLAFAPTAVGPATGTLDIPSNDPDTPTVSLDVTGNGTPAPAPDISVSSLDVAFGNVSVGQTATPTTITVTNTGNLDLVIGQIADATNPLPAPYGIANDTCSGQTLEILGSGTNTCTFDVTFAPTAAGLVPEAFDIPSNDTDEDPVIVNVSGTGTAPEISVSSLAVAFGNVEVGQTATPTTITVTNTGNENLVLGSLGALTAPFGIASDTCSGQTLESLGSGTNTCTFDVTFAPTVVGAVSQAFDIPSNDADENPVTVNVSGTGAVPDISVSPLAVDFGDVNVGDSSDQTVTVTNDGDADLVLGNVGAPAAPFSIAADNCSGQTLAPADTCTISVEFAPDAVQGYSSSFDILSDDPDEDPVTVDVSGSGTASGGQRSGGSAFDPVTLLGLSLFGFALKRRRR